MTDSDLQKKIDGFLNSALKKFLISDFDSAIRELKAAEMLDKENPEILYNLGINYCRLGLDKTAIAYFKKSFADKTLFDNIVYSRKIFTDRYFLKLIEDIVKKIAKYDIFLYLQL